MLCEIGETISLSSAIGTERYPAETAIVLHFPPPSLKRIYPRVALRSNYYQAGADGDAPEMKPTMNHSRIHGKICGKGKFAGLEGVRYNGCNY
ncbi:MAG: hypothetical protein AAB360_01320 [Patescibacteria group bacterium]